MRRRKKYRLRPARLMAIIIALAIVLGVPGVFYAHGRPGEEPLTEETVVVQPGDTLWYIAKKFTEPGQDIRETIAAIRNHNNLMTAVIHPGQTLKIPTR